MDPPFFFEVFFSYLHDEVLGVSALSLVHNFSIQVVPDVELDLDLSLEKLILQVRYPFRIERLFVSLNGYAYDTSVTTDISFVTIDILNAAIFGSIQRGVPTQVVVRAILSSSSYLASKNISRSILIPSLPRPAIASVSQNSNSIYVYVDSSILYDLSLATGFLFQFHAVNGANRSKILEVPRTKETAFDDNRINATFVIDNDNTKLPIASSLSVSITVYFVQYPGLFSLSSPSYAFSVLPPPDAPEPFTNNVFGECVNFTWSHQNSDILDFTISVLSLPRVIVDGSLRAHSICGTFSRNIIYIVGISCRSRSGVSHEVYTEVRYYLLPRLVFSSAPIPSIGLAPSDPPLEALIYDFPTGASLTGFVVYFSSDEDPLVNRLLAFVNGTVLPENPSAPLQV